MNYRGRTVYFCKLHDILLCAVMSLLMLAACRESADDVYDFSGSNNFTYDAAEKSLAGQFDAFWMAMNANYSLWDLEQEKYGLNWDATYDKYMPYFKQLDAQYVKDSIDVPDSVLLAAYREILSPLHDGHLSVQVRNVRNKNGKYLAVTPSIMRLQEERPEDMNNARAFSSSLEYYAKSGRLDPKSSLSVSVDGREYISTQLTAAIALANDSIAAGSSRKERYELAKNDFQVCLDLILKASASAVVDEYEDLCGRYSYLGFKLPSVKGDYGTGYLIMKSTVIDGSIPYLYLSNFKLSPFLDGDDASMYKNQSYFHFYQPMVRAVWKSWFDSIQKLYASGNLKGVIVDVRSNGGGYCDDYKYIMGALAGENVMLGYIRYKSGTARLDYSPLNKCYAAKYPGNHAAILGDERFKVIVIGNAMSVSMAEITSLTTKCYDNAYLVGKRTHGGLCTLVDGSSYDYTYSGIVGVANETPFYGYIPVSAVFGRDKESLDGIGVTPNYDVSLDEQLFQSTKQDTQLDKAIEVVSIPNPQ